MHTPKNKLTTKLNTFPLALTHFRGTFPAEGLLSH